MKYETVVLIVLAWLPLFLGAQDDDPQVSVGAPNVTLKRIVFGSCCHQGVQQPIWSAVFKQEPDLFIFTGDNIYANPRTEEVLREIYEEALAKPGLKKLLKERRVLATYDDHDYGLNDSGSENPIRAAAARACLDAFGVAESDPRRKHEGVYGSYHFGPEGRKAQVILLDTRYFRDRLRRGPNRRGKGYGSYKPHSDPQKTLLGKQQWEWLRKALLQPADLRIVVSSTQVLAEENGREGWANFPHEKRRLLALIRETSASGVIFISGDVHYAELTAEQEFDYPLYDFTSSALAHKHNTKDGKPTPYSSVSNKGRVIGSSYTGANFGRIDIQWDGKDTKIRLSLHDVAGRMVFERMIPLRQLQSRK